MTKRKEYGICAQCGRSVFLRFVRGRCITCYNKALKDPDFARGPRGSMRGARVHVAERLLKAIAAGRNGCWIWTGQVNNAGYEILRGHRAGQRVNVLAHRESYEIFVAPIPEGLVIDHLCRTPRCINFDHLEPVTYQVNTLRSPIAIAARWARRTHCEHGHEFTPENTALRPRWDNPKKFYRACRTCKRQRYAATRERGAK